MRSYKVATSSSSWRQNVCTKCVSHRVWLCTAHHCSLDPLDQGEYCTKWAGTPGLFQVTQAWIIVSLASIILSPTQLLWQEMLLPSLLGVGLIVKFSLAWSIPWGVGGWMIKECVAHSQGHRNQSVYPLLPFTNCNKGTEQLRWSTDEVRY